MQAKVTLIGFSGSGKTSVGRLLQQSCGWRWVDLDCEIEKTAGRKVADIILGDGESCFRNLEHEVLCKVLAGPVDVISLGGGALLRAENRELVLSGTVPVFLAVTAETAAARVAQDEQQADGEAIRPLLGGEGVGPREIEARVLRLMENRRGLYDLAPVKVWTDWLTPEEVTQTVRREVQNFGEYSGVERLVIIPGKSRGLA